MVGLLCTAMSGAVVGTPNAVEGKALAVSGLSSVPAFATRVSANHHYLLDQYGRPFLLMGDAPQCMATQLSLSNMNYYFARRARQGFDAMWVDILCGPYTGGRSNYSTYDGILPFSTPGDLATPNPRYFARIDAMVKLAASRHMV